jgi:hypothetical protein
MAVEARGFPCASEETTARHRGQVDVQLALMRAPLSAAPHNVYIGDR